MSIYETIAAAILPVLPDFSVGGSDWLITRATGNGVTSAATAAELDSSLTLYFVRNKVDALGINVAGTVLASAEWLCFAELETDVQVNDLCTSVDDDTRKFRITSAPQTDFGLILTGASAVR